MQHHFVIQKMFFIYFLILLATFVFYTERKRAKIWKASKNLVTPPVIPVFGNGLMFFGKSPPQLFEKVQELIAAYGQSSSVWFGTQLSVMLTNPKDVEAVLSSQTMITKSLSYDMMQPWLGDGLLMSTGSKWHSRRKTITPTFHFKILTEFVKIFEEQGTTFMNILSRYKPTDKIDTFRLISLYALDVICETAMGTTAEAQLNLDNNYIKAVKEITQVIHLRSFNFLFRSSYLFRFSSGWYKQKRALKVLHKFTDDVIVNRRAELLKQQKLSSNQNTEDDIGARKNLAFLDVLLQATIDGKPMTDLEIREEVDTFMFEGHDTTTSAITFAFYEISKKPTVQEKLFQEVRNVLGDDKTVPVTINDLNNLNYLDLVIKETLRMYPSVPSFARHVAKDTQINDKVIPAGSTVTIKVYSMNHDPLLFKDPEEFIPERFETEKTKDNFNPYAYVPFSAGPRNCIGQKFAMYEMKSIIAKTVRNFELSLASTEKPVLISELILRPWNKILLHVKPRVNK